MENLALQFIDGKIAQSDYDLPANEKNRLAFLRVNHRERVPVWCLCYRSTQYPNGLPLSVVLNGDYFLRRYEGTDEMHLTECRFSGSPRKCRRIASVSGLQENEDGSFALSLRKDVFPVLAEERASRAGAGDLDENTPAKKGKSGTSRGSMGLGGILRFLLRESGTADWDRRFEGRRNPPNTMRRLREVATRTRARGRSLSSLIVWPLGLVSPSVIEQAFESSPICDQRDQREILVIGEIVRSRPSKSGKVQCIELGWHQSVFFVFSNVWEEITDANPLSLIFDSSGKPQHRIWALMSVRLRRPQRGSAGQSYFYITNLAAILMSNSLIPADSAYEIKMAEHLVAAGRNFSKPLRFEKSHEVFPDFVLVDTKPETHVEVWGMDSEAYRKRRVEKVAYAQANNIPLLEWDAIGGDPLPALP